MVKADKIKVTDKWLRAQLNKAHESESKTTHNGVVIRITQKGSISFSCRFSINDKRKNLSLGSYPQTSLGEALEAKKEALRLVDQGLDPAVEKKKTSLSYDMGNNFSTLYIHWFDEIYANGRGNDVRRRKAVINHMFEAFGDVPVTHITYQMLTKFFRTKAKVVPAQTRDLIYLLKPFWRWLAEEGFIEGTPILDGIEAAKVGAVAGMKTRVLSPQEIRMFWAAANRTRLIFRNAAIGQMSLLTGCRHHEFQMALAEEYNSVSGIWTISKHKTAYKTKESIIRPLATHAKHIMGLALNHTVKGESIWPSQPELKSGWGRQSLSYICKDHVNHIRNKLDFPIESFSLHDLRRTCRTLMEGLAAHNLIHADAPALALGHKKDRISQTYNKWDYSGFLGDAYETYERLLMAILASSSNDVVEIVKDFAANERKRQAEKPACKVVDINDAFLAVGRNYCG